jgi:hypothetical protein
MPLALAGLAALGLIVTTVLVHYEALRIAGRLMLRFHVRPRPRVLVAIMTCLVAHLIAVAVLAGLLAALLQVPGMGRIAGAFEPGVRDLLYLALTSYTTLGIGDIWPEGPIRLVIGVAALNGFLLITWTASFTYLVMQRYWHPSDG